MSLARKYRIVPTSSPWVSEDGIEGDRSGLVENTVPFDMRKFRKFKPEFLVEWNAPYVF